jgi:hypothetical protein
MLSQTDWSALQLSRHEQIALMSAATPLFNWLDAAGKLADLNPIVPLRGGQQVYIFKKTVHKDEQSDTSGKKVERLARLETDAPLDYGINVRLRLSCLQTTGHRRKVFILTGPLTSLEHGLLMTALAGVPNGTDFRYFGLKGKGPSRFNLETLFSHGPVLCDADTGNPVFGNTMTPFLGTVADFVRHAEISST